jgi:hypothetical protein
MNVSTSGAPPTPPPAPPPVQRPAAATSRDAGAREAGQHGLPQRRERVVVELPDLKPVSVQEFRVMLGALPPAALHRGGRSGRTGDGSALDVYA